ncbi:MAG: hypothetical protein LUG55_03280 [Clostridiales bacterium]|nr:hypothetical protein [Clostridiales bacterium]
MKRQRRTKFITAWLLIAALTLPPFTGVAEANDAEENTLGEVVESAIATGTSGDVVPNVSAQNMAAMGNGGDAGIMLLDITEGDVINGATVAIGLQSIADGSGAIAIGDAASATGTGSIAIGTYSVATGGDSIAIGNNANINAGPGYDGNIAIGAYASVPDGARNSVFGTGASTSYGSYNSVFGAEASASFIYSSAFGGKAQATEMYSSAFGGNAQALEEYATAVGSNAEAVKYATAVGSNAKATYESSVAIGYESYTDRPLFKAIYVPSGADIDSVKETLKGDLDGEDSVPVTRGGVVSIGDPSGQGASGIAFTRQLTGLAAGALDTDAVNVAQLKALDSISVKYTDANMVNRLTFADGEGSAVIISNVARG